ncbi:inverse autotransporter beta domain-containing protein [Acerihabitans sp. KWT182]|uniref:Inverse autotransporter beta domain-containing protein n=1 Tax=Acerihabitans sp. KWT182 TaxID=3157919 RepID=A0AAU7QBS5_9GAMM
MQRKNSSSMPKSNSGAQVERKHTTGSAAVYKVEELQASPNQAHHGYSTEDRVPSKSENREGSAVINLPLMVKSLKSASFDYLLPLNKDDNNLIFSQIGARRYDGRNIINMGVGQRHFFEDWMLGYNSFYDRQLSGSQHQRLGIGLEFWTKNLKFSANSYHRLSGWKTSNLLLGHEERAANGYDLNVESFLPFYPQIGTRVKYEHYYGDSVTTINRHERQKKPFISDVRVKL